MHKFGILSFVLGKKMKITNTRRTEITIINLYKCSTKKEKDEESKYATKLIHIIIVCFELISVFTKINHTEIVKKLYFTKENISVISLKQMERKVFIQERTLLMYRKKYCEVIDLIFVLIEDLNLDVDK